MSRVKSAKEILANKFLSFSPDGEYCKDCGYPIYPKEECAECKRVKRKDQETLAKWVEMIGGLKAWKEYTKERFTRTNYNAKAFKAAEGYSYTDSSILFHGPRGTGKSHLAAIIKRPLITAGVGVLTIHLSDFFSSVRANIKDGTFLDTAIHRMVSVKVLSLEDMATDKPSEWNVELYYRIIDGRYRQGRHGLILTMNQSLDQLESLWSRFDPAGRVVSRLWEMTKGNQFSLDGEKDHRRDS